MVPWAVLVLGLAATGILYGSILSSTADRKTREYSGEIQSLRDDIQGAVQRQVSVLQATAGVVAAKPDLTQAQFAIFYEDLIKGADAKIPAAVGLSLWRPWAEREELRRDAILRGATSYDLRPPGPRPEAHAVVLIMPEDKRNRIAPGFDMHADPVRRAAMETARRTGGPAITGRVFLRNDSAPNQPAFIIYLPLYHPDGKTLRGYVYAGMRAERLFAPVLNGSDAHVGLSLRSGADLVYGRPLGEKVDHTERFTVPLDAVAGDFQAEATFSSEFGFQGVIRPWVLPVGTSLSLLLFLLAGTLGRAHEASKRRAAEQGLLAEVAHLTGGRSEDEDVLDQIASRTATTLDATCRIDLLQDGVLRTVNTRLDQRVLDELERDYPRLESDTLLRAALETGRAQHAIGYSAIDEGHRQRLAGFDVGPVIVAPLGVGDRALGAVTVSRPRGKPDFTPEAVALAESIAGRMALAIENERLYRDLERRVEERTRDLEASNHELESFCYSVSHDLRTPLRSLDGFGRVLEEDYGDRLDAEGLGYLERIRAATRRMDELITALLTLSRLTRREIVPVATDVTAMVTDMMHDLDSESRVRLTVEDDLSVRADPRMLAVVFDNLLSNSIKFGGRTDDPAIIVGRAEDGSIFVRDNGAGFDMAYAAKLFQPFERLHSVREFPGHGIGLATVERILRRHGGEVRAEGQPGEGATFYIKFPE